MAAPENPPLRMAVVAACLVLLAIAAAAGVPPASAAQDARPEAAERTHRDVEGASVTLPHVVVGIDEAFPPYQYLDEEGAPAGFDVDLMRALAEVRGVSVEFRAGPWHEILGALKRGELDLVPSVVRTEAREGPLDFSVATSSASHVPFRREGETTIRSARDLAGLRVAVERASFWDEELRSRRDVVVLPVPAPADCLRRVRDQEADVAILLDTQGLFLARELGIDGVHIAGPSLSSRDYRFAVPEGRDGLVLALNEGLGALRSDGAYGVLFDRWFGVLQPSPWIDPRLRPWLLWGLVMLGGALLSSHLWSRTLERRVARRTEELRAREEENRGLERRLLRSEKMEALGRFAGGIAHDFNNLLTSILGNAAMARRELGGGAPARLESIERAAKTGGRLTRQLLAFGRREPGDPRPTRWDEVVREALGMLSPLVGSTIELDVRSEPDLAHVSIDPTQALQVVMNLVANARDAMGGKGRIEIVTANEEGPPPCVRLTVRDQGVGMDEATRARIFEPFFTTRAETEGGTGLGLSTVYGIVKRHGGEIEVESEPGRGSAFHVRLPRDDSAGGPRPGASLPAAPAEAAVLLVEADPEVRAVGEALLRSLGHTVVGARSGREAMQRARDMPEIAVAITDADLPGFPGLALARDLLALRPGLRVLLSSEGPDPGELRSEARVGHLPKPYTREALGEALSPPRSPPGRG